MKYFVIAATALGLSLSAAATASATDLYVAPGAAAPMSYDDASGFDGFYFGVQKDWWWTSSYLGVDAVAGVNFVLGDNFLIGAEVKGGILTNFSSYEFEGYVRGRAGLLLDDSVLLYKVVEIGTVDGDALWGIGGGLEVMVSDNLSIRGEVRGIGGVGDPLSYAAASVGFLWHFN